MGWFEGLHVINLLMGLVGLGGLLIILKWPWDLYFEAKNIAYNQTESQQKNIKIQPQDQHYIKTMTRKLLIFAIGLHLLSAIVIAFATYQSNGTLDFQLREEFPAIIQAV